jgi:excisionase family DNA binding protein
MFMEALVMGKTFSIPSTVIDGVATLLGPYTPGLTKQEVAERLGSLADSQGSAAPTNRLMKIGEAAQRLSLGTRTVWRLVEQGKLPAVRVGSSVRFRETDVQSLIMCGA